jgi:hypothetical protein
LERLPGDVDRTGPANGILVAAGAQGKSDDDQETLAAGKPVRGKPHGVRSSAGIETRRGHDGESLEKGSNRTVIGSDRWERSVKTMRAGLGEPVPKRTTEGPGAPGSVNGYSWVFRLLSARISPGPCCSLCA